ncbi:MAG: DUF1573 domain-containing protein [Candidatus Aminicenantia bacterium]
MRKRRLICLIGIVLIFFSYGLAGKNQKQPRIKFSKESWDFGKIKQGEIVTHIFEFENKGESELIIEKVSTSCGCTAALISNKKLLPGEKGEIKATFNSRGFQGKIIKYIIIHSNDPNDSAKQLRIMAEVLVPPRPKILLIPSYADVGVFLNKDEITHHQKIKNNGELELVITNILAYSKDINFFLGEKKISFPMKIAAGKEKEIEIKLNPKNKKGVIREYIQIRSNDPNRPSTSLYLTGYALTQQELRELFKRYKSEIQ